MGLIAAVVLAGCGGSDEPSAKERKAESERKSREQAKVILNNYFAAISAGDGRAACGLMVPDLRAQQAFRENGRRVSCEEGIHRLGADPEIKRAQDRVKTTGAIVEGNTVILRISYLGDNIAFYDFAREGGAWRIVAIREIKD